VTHSYGLRARVALGGSSLPSRAPTFHIPVVAGIIMKDFIPAFPANAAIFNQAQMDSLISALSKQTKSAGISAGGDKRTDKSIRKTEGSVIDPEIFKDIYTTVTAATMTINEATYQYDLQDIEPLQFLSYQEGGHYDWHLDIGKGVHSNRKLSIIIPLNDPSEYEGGELLVKAGRKETSIPLKPGVPIFFPSMILHKVTPVTSGKRYVLVGWFRGPAFR